MLFLGGVQHSQFTDVTQLENCYAPSSRWAEQQLKILDRVVNAVRLPRQNVARWFPLAYLRCAAMQSGHCSRASFASAWTCTLSIV